MICSRIVLLFSCILATAYVCDAACNGDPNAVVGGCSTYCGQRCSTRGQHVDCPVINCIVAGCECKKGWLYDDNRMICVRPRDCSC